MYASREITNPDVTSHSFLLTLMKKNKRMQRGDLVCFEGDENELLLGVGLVVDIKGNIDDLTDFESAVKAFYDDDEYWKITHILPAAPMILVLWTRSPTYDESDFNLYNIDKLGYSFMWVYPTEVKVISPETLENKRGE
jgi:hypothetical protein